MENSNGTNKDYKDRLFKFIFGNPDNKEWTLSLYNAINKTSYENAEDIQLTTIEDAVYMSMKNDVSFLVDNTMSFYEQQSTYNPNMPMRFLIYAGMVYSNYIESDDYHRFSYKQQKAPVPKCVCFYNGVPQKDDTLILKLSDSFPPDSNSDIEVTVTMININYGHNRELMETCRPLEEYAWFVDRVRSNQQKSSRKDKESLRSSINKAIYELSDDSLIKPFLMKNKAEVERMCITEYNEERALAQLEQDVRADALEEGKREGIKEGRKEGRKEGEIETAVNLLKLGLLTKENIAAVTGFTVEKIIELAAQNNFTVS